MATAQQGQTRMSWFFISIVLAILGSTLYHVFQKSIPPAINPALVLLITYSVAFGGTLLLLVFVFPLEQALSVELGKITPIVFLPGLAILCIELGFLLAYRSGWNINVASLTVNLVVAIALIPLGLVLHAEKLTLTQGIGVVVCIFGLVLLNWK
jgi:uncharacterized membrane protein